MGAKMTTKTDTEKQIKCNKCQRTNIRKIGKRASGFLKQQFYCKNCLHFFSIQRPKSERMAEIKKNLDY
jgi:transposase-like protein